MSVSAEQIIALLPLVMLAGTAVLVMLAIAFWRNHRLVFCITLAGLAGSFALLFATDSANVRMVTSLVVIDRWAVIFLGLSIFGSFAVTLFSYPYFQSRAEKPEEFYLLLLIATFGSGVLVCSSHFASFFLGLEILSVSLYPMIAYQVRSAGGLEAGLKYLVLAGVSSAFLLFGMALVYAETGALQFAEIANKMASGTSVVLWTGMGMMVVGFGFKLAVVPFHFWSPDIYQGAPIVTAAFVSSVSKGAILSLLLRLFSDIFQSSEAMFTIFSVLAAGSMVAGNLLALFQNNLKRLLAYSSIAHVGYMLVAFLAAGRMAPVAVAFYVAGYFITTLGTFGIMTVLSVQGPEAETLDRYEGLAWRRPWLCAGLTMMLLSLAGIPFSVGFMGKFYVLAAGAASGLWWLIIVLVVTSSIGLFYYLRVVMSLYRGMAVTEAARSGRSEWPAGIALVVLSVLLVGLGVYPGPLFSYLQAALSTFQ